MTTDAMTNTYTQEEFLALEDEGNNYELIEGELIHRGRLDGRHGKIIAKLSRYLDVFVDDHNIGYVFTEAACTLNTSSNPSFLIPDVCFVSKERIPNDFDGPIPVAPDLVIEVISPSDTQELISKKNKAYLNSGVKLIWSIFMEDKFALVRRINEPVRIVNIQDELDGEDVIPGFKLPLNKIFV